MFSNIQDKTNQLQQLASVNSTYLILCFTSSYTCVYTFLPGTYIDRILYCSSYISFVSFLGATPQGIAVDANIRRVFYTDYWHEHIAAMDYDGNNHDVIITSAQNLHNPRAIVLHPETRYTYGCDNRPHHR